LQFRRSYRPVVQDYKLPRLAHTRVAIEPPLDLVGPTWEIAIGCCLAAAAVAAAIANAPTDATGSCGVLTAMRQDYVRQARIKTTTTASIPPTITVVAAARAPAMGVARVAVFEVDVAAARGAIENVPGSKPVPPKDKTHVLSEAPVKRVPSVCQACAKRVSSVCQACAAGLGSEFSSLPNPSRF
jgi:hypothetical protein